MIADETVRFRVSSNVIKLTLKGPPRTSKKVTLYNSFYIHICFYLFFVDLRNHVSKMDIADAVLELVN